MSISKDSTILVTGGHGFVGWHVRRAFAEQGFDEVIACRSKSFDLLDARDVDALFADYRPDVVVHLAAQCGGIGINREKPGEFCYNNLRMGMNVIEACRQWNVQKLVCLGTVCAYPKFTPVPFKEDDLYAGYPEETNAPYGLAKRMLLDLMQAYRKQYGFNGVYLLPVNMAGEHDNFNDNSSHVIPAVLKKFHNAKMNGDESVVLWGDGSPSREFLYAGDCADAIVKATLEYNDPDPVNIGTGKEITIRELAEEVRSVVGYEGEIVWDTDKPNGQPRRCLDTTRARERFGFTANTELREILERTYTWAVENEVL